MFLTAFASLRSPESEVIYDRKRAEGKRHNAASFAWRAVGATSSSPCSAPAPPTTPTTAILISSMPPDPSLHEPWSRPEADQAHQLENEARAEIGPEHELRSAPEHELAGRPVGLESAGRSVARR